MAWLIFDSSKLIARKVQQTGAHCQSTLEPDATAYLWALRGSSVSDQGDQFTGPVFEAKSVPIGIATQIDFPVFDHDPEALV
jgi:hypothetical protein